MLLTIVTETHKFRKIIHKNGLSKYKKAIKIALKYNKSRIEGDN